MGLDLNLSDHTFTLLPERAVFWQKTSTLILTDIHLGKSGHFRKSGIAAPQSIDHTNLGRMDELLQSHNPERLLVLGDLFHSDANRQWLQFEQWRRGYQSMEFILVAGNHDLLHRSFYQMASVKVLSEYVEHGFHFIHQDNGQNNDEHKFSFSGHVHPGVLMRGKGRQSVRLPCFYHISKELILPAFGEFTGLHILKVSDAEKVYPIVDNTVFQLHPV